VERTPQLAGLGPPPTRGDCTALPRPCPRTRCRYNLAPDLGRAPPPSGLAATSRCALDVADAGGVEDVNELARLLGWSRGRMRHVVATAIRHMQERMPASAGPFESSSDTVVEPSY